MSFKHLWTIAALGASIDQASNSLSVFDVWEELQVDVQKKTKEDLALDVMVPRPFKLVTLWHREKKDTDQFFSKIVLERPGGDQEIVFDGVMKANPAANRHRHLMMFPGMKVNQSGDYIFKVYYKESKDDEFKFVGSTPVTVKVNKILADQKQGK